MLVFAGREVQNCSECERNIQLPSLVHPRSKGSGEAEGIAPGRTDGIPGKKTAEVEYVEPVIQILGVGLHPDHKTVLRINICPRGSPNRKILPHPSANKID